MPLQEASFGTGAAGHLLGMFTDGNGIVASPRTQVLQRTTDGPRAGLGGESGLCRPAGVRQGEHGRLLLVSRPTWRRPDRGDMSEGPLSWGPGRRSSSGAGKRCGATEGLPSPPPRAGVLRALSFL